MRNIFIIIAGLLLTTQSAVAQKNVFVVSDSSSLSAYQASKITFDDDLLTFKYGDITTNTEEKITSSFTVAFKSSDFKTFAAPQEVGICYSDINPDPTINDFNNKIGTSIDNYTFSISGLNPGTTYYYRAYMKVNDVVNYGDVCSVTTPGTKPSGIYINGHRFIDLGLPSGTLWAETNVDAMTAADGGGYYAWGETETKTEYTLDTYKFKTADGGSSKYNTTDSLITLQSEDDVATVKWGPNCRIPTRAECKEVFNEDYCTLTWTSKINSKGDTISGYEVVSNANGNSIFVPAAGIYSLNSIVNYNKTGNYWGSTQEYTIDEKAYGVFFFNGYSGSDFSWRYFGHTIRPVAKLP